MTPGVAYTFGERFGGAGIGIIADNAAAGAHRSGLLNQVVSLSSSSPSVPPEQLETVPLGRHINRLPSYLLKDVAFDYVAARMLDTDSALCHGWNGMCLRTHRQAREAGMVTVVERASTHPTTQRELLRREYREHGIEADLNHECHYRRQVAELDAADAVFVPSEFVYESFLDRGFDEERLRLLPFGVDVERYRPNWQSTGGVNGGAVDNPFRLAFVGQLSLRKGVQYLLPAWRRADVEGELLLAGKRTSAAAPVLDEYTGDPSVRFLGWVDDVPSLFDRADAFTLPSIEEGSALVSYEAMAAGLPSIVTPNVGSLVRDGEEGIVVPPRKVEALAEAIERLARDARLRENLGRAARNRVAEYTWADYGNRVAQTYRALLGDA